MMIVFLALVQGRPKLKIVKKKIGPEEQQKNRIHKTQTASFN